MQSRALSVLGVYRSSFSRTENFPPVSASRSVQPMPDNEGSILKEMELRSQQKLLACIRSLPAEDRAVFEKWYADNQKTVPPSDWPGFNRYFPDGLK
jgi:hypothetical protein